MAIEAERFAEGATEPANNMINGPFFLGFDDLERGFDHAAKSAGDNYPPYNIERIPGQGGETIRIILAVAGFARDQLDIVLAGNRLTVQGRQESDPSRVYLHRGIAARQFQRGFVLAAGLTVRSAKLGDGLLAIELWRPEPNREVCRIEICEDS